MAVSYRTRLKRETEAEPSTDEGVLGPTLGWEAQLYAESDDPERQPSLRPFRGSRNEPLCYSGQQANCLTAERQLLDWIRKVCSCIEEMLGCVCEAP